MKKYEGTVQEVLVEQFSKERGTLNGRSSQNKLIHFMGDENLVGKTVKVKVIKAFPATMRGELVN